MLQCHTPYVCHAHLCLRCICGRQHWITLHPVLQVANGGAYEGLLVDTVGRAINRSYGERVACHEAGHFLIAVLLGLLPKGYTLSAADALQK